MIIGMTGFGTGSFSYKGKSYVINIRSVNHKFLDYVVSLPDELSSCEAKIKKKLSQFLNRGRVTFALSSSGPSAREPVLNKQLLFKYSGLIKEICRSLAIKQNVSLSDIINLPEVIYFKRVNEYSSRKFLSSFDRALGKALADLVSLRKKEGRVVQADLLKRMQKVNQKLQLIKKRLIYIIEQQKARLSGDELKDFLKDYNIEEEVVRLEFHVKTFKNTLSQRGPAGKVLDFITQEMQREINTLSAKFRDSQASYSSVIIKDEIEKAREQLQNVE